jgi:hypothetical protein
MIRATDRKSSKTKIFVMLTVATMMLVMLALTFLICCYTLKAENHVRHVAILNVASERIAKTVRGMEMNAMNVFDEVQQHLDSPEAVITALKSKTTLNPDIKGYFAAFEPDYFPQRGKWFQPYIYKAENNSEYVESQVGSGSEDYTKSELYVRAKKQGTSFWSEPYYYYDGSDMSGHYCSFMTPLYDTDGKLACICGADMTFEWLTKELKQIDYASKQNELLNKYLLTKEPDFYTVVMNNDGTCIAHPEGKGLLLKDKQVVSNLKQKKSGTVEMIVGGKPVTVYYGPIKDNDWSVAVVVQTQDTPQPIILAGLMLLVVAILGMIVIFKLVKI